MKHTAAIAIFLAAAAHAAGAAQAPTSEPSMVRAAGMPLADGELAPGMLTVRIVKGAFEGDLAGIEVVADVGGGASLRARTGDRGRAEFGHLPVGATVRVSATVGSERMESEPFQLPATSGVRILLVATGDGSAIAPAIRNATPVDALPAVPLASPGEASSMPIVLVFAGATLAFAASIVWQSRTRARKPLPRSQSNASV